MNSNNENAIISDNPIERVIEANPASKAAIKQFLLFNSVLPRYRKVP